MSPMKRYVHKQAKATIYNTKGLKPLAKVVNIAEHGDELGHRNLLWFRLRVVTQPPYAGPYGLGKVLPLIPN
jgi:hypothetical protein